MSWPAYIDRIMATGDVQDVVFCNITPCYVLGASVGSHLSKITVGEAAAFAAVDYFQLDQELTLGGLRCRLIGFNLTDRIFNMDLRLLVPGDPINIAVAKSHTAYVIAMGLPNGHGRILNAIVYNVADYLKRHKL